VKITKLSLVAIAAMTLTTGAMADVDMKIGGQAVVYYQTADAGEADMFAENSSAANAGLQLNANADIGNGFGLGFQGTALNTFGLEGNLVDNVMQVGGGDISGETKANAGDYFAITKAYLTKQIANTTLKAGRQELPKSLSPLAFTEGWNVFKNTFDAIVAINSDIPDTTLVGAYVSRSNEHADLGSFTGLIGTSKETDTAQNNGAYMLTAANKSIANTPITASYYQLPGSDLSALWLDVKANKLGPVDLAVQGGTIMNGASGGKDTKSIGAKIAANLGGVDTSLAYSKVNNGDVPVFNLGTGVKTPLYTQMVANQGAIRHDNNTFVLKAAMAAGPGKLTAQYGLTSDDSAAENDYNELDLIYTFKALGTDMLAAYVMQKADNDTFAGGTDDTNNIIRVWSRYNF